MRSRNWSIDIEERLFEAMQTGIPAVATVAGPDGRPSVVRAVGTHVPTRDPVTFYFRNSTAGLFLKQLEWAKTISVVFAKPWTYFSVQLKGEIHEVRPAAVSDEARLANYATNLQWEVELMCFVPSQVKALLTYDLADVTAISFWPREVFNQTPGPGAGAKLYPL